MKVTASTDTGVFKAQLKAYKTAIDEDIAIYGKQVQKSTLQQYGAGARLEIDAFLDILERGGKRIRGSLVMLGYEMSGGKNHQMILQAARAIEMLHAYILIFDDIQDRSAIRRGGPAAHIGLADYHRQHHLADDPGHFGVSIALNGATAGAHAAQIILANLDAPEELRLKVISIVNRTMQITTYGQTNDLLNEIVADVKDADVERVLEWKTAHYTFLNPLHVGMVLAGADCEATDAITEYAMRAGKAFQISDDILGIFGNEQYSGKAAADDIREGKRTILTMYALRHASQTDKNFLIQMLGNRHLTPVELERCKDILQGSGALAHAKKTAEQNITLALAALDKEQTRWSKQGIQFLRGLAHYLLARQT